MNRGTSPEPVVSVVFPVFGAGRFASEAIESVLAQSFPGWELVLVNSERNIDESRRERIAGYAERFAGRVRSVDCDDPRGDTGLSNARNAGVRQARGRLIAFLDSNDVWLPNRLEDQVRLIDLSGAAMVYGLSQHWYSWSGNDDDLTRDFVPEAGVVADILYAPSTLLRALYPLGPVRGPSIGDLLMTRESFERAGGFGEASGAQADDFMFLAKACLRESVFVAGKCWNRRRVHPQPLTASGSAGARNRAERSRLLNWLTTYLDNEGVTDNGIRTALVNSWAALPPREDVHYKGWHFRVADGNEAELENGPGRQDAVRVTITQRDSDTAWDIQLNLKRQTVLQGQTYRVRFEACADAARSLSVGMSMAREPWSSLGLYRSVDVTSEWQSYEFDFVAEADNDDARIHFDLGGASVAVQLAEVGLFFGDGSPAVCGVQFGNLHRVTPIGRDWGYGRGIPIDRPYIENFLNQHASDIRGCVLEIGNNTYTRVFGGDKVTRSDVLHISDGNPNATIVGDLSNAPHICDATFDCIILTQTLQCIYDLQAAIRTLYRILRPGGVLLATIPGISRNNCETWSHTWYWSFTSVSARRLFGEAFPAADMHVQPFGNLLAATSFLYGLSASELTQEELDFSDHGYEVVFGIRAIKREPAAMRTHDPATAQIRTPKHTDKGLILMYHRISEPEADPFSLCVSPENFAGHLRTIRREATMLSLAEMADGVRRGRVPHRSVAITFDDGYADNLYNAKPILKEHGIPATIFITTGTLGQGREFWWDELQRILLSPGTLPDTLELIVQGVPYRWELGEAAFFSEGDFNRRPHWTASDEPPGRRHSLYLEVWRLLRPLADADRLQTLDAMARWSGLTKQREAYRAMNPAEITTLAEGGLVEIGAHTVTHPALSDLSAEAQHMEMTGSKERLEQIVGLPVTSFAYPYGALSAETMAIARKSGFRVACSTLPQTVEAGAECLRLPRIHVRDWGEREFSQRIADLFLQGTTSMGGLRH